VHIGILFRKATSGIKSVLKLYKGAGLDITPHEYPNTYKLCNLEKEKGTLDELIEKYSGSNMSTLSMRIELYVSEGLWKSSNQFTKEFLFTFMGQVEEQIARLILNWNEYKHVMHMLTKEGKLNEYIKQNCPYHTLIHLSNKD